MNQNYFTWNCDSLYDSENMLRNVIKVSCIILGQLNELWAENLVQIKEIYGYINVYFSKFRDSNVDFTLDTLYIYT